MKKLYALCYALVLLCIAGTAILLTLTPDRIPVHYNFAGEVDRFGSKYENLLFPFFTTLMGAFFIGLAKQQSKKGTASNEKVLLYSGLVTLIFFDALSFYFMIKPINHDPAAVSSINIDLMKFIGIAMGILFVLVGNIMPKLRRNSLIGLRTSWSLSNDNVWQKSQRFAGISMVICGLAMIVMAIFIPGNWNLLMMNVVIMVWLVSCLIASYRYYKSE